MKDWGVEWLFVRIAASQEFHAPLPDVRRWPLLDLLQASAALDALGVAIPAIAESKKVRGKG